jgi:hypothetical protein
MMYDQNFLYLGARVGDPAPMRSAIDPKVDGDLGWKGGSVQVRLSTDPKLGWPLDATHRARLTPEQLRQGLGQRREDVSESLVHLSMWHHRASAQPCLLIQYGMDYHRHVVNPAGYRGAFRKDSSGAAYTLEYAVPWSLLHPVGRVPRPGDALGACWQVNWADENGRVWLGRLLEITRPGIHRFTYEDASVWGRAIYHDRGQLPTGTVRPRGNAD